MSLENKQLSFGSEQKENKKVTVLGIEFENDDARREYFREELRKKLPELRKIEGFPIGNDDDILKMSDPPFYTICPNPWLSDVLSSWRGNTSQKKIEAPLSSDVHEGKNDPIYVAHTYHTKVPFRAIMKYMLYYTNPGDIVYDGFAGTGMTGVAAEKCGDLKVVKEVMGDDFTEESVGQRNAILIDIAPAASFIGQNHNRKAEIPDTYDTLDNVLMNLRNQMNWSVHTLGVETTPEKIAPDDFFNNNLRLFGEINYTIWSELYICPSCTQEFNYWDAAVDELDGKEVVKELSCPHCGAKFEKRNLEKVYESKFDFISGEIARVPKIEPVRINYTYQGKRKTKKADWYDYSVWTWFDNYENYNCVEKYKFVGGVKTSEPIRNGLKFFHQVYTKRNLALLDKYLFLSSSTTKVIEGQFLLGSAISRLSKFNRYMPQHNRHVGPMANAFYLPPLSAEINAISQLELQLKKLNNAWLENQYQGNVISNQSSTSVNIPDNSVDYIFIDPPFGSNIMYSELSFIREAWLKIFTNNKKEAIENKAQGKTLGDYTVLMKESFKEAYRILKPNSWITVEFSNTSASVWNALQFVIQSSGFIIASVDALDKKRGGFHGIITTTGVKQDLVISAYKPTIESINKMQSSKNTKDSAWIFIDQHLEKLPVFTGSKGEATLIVERTARILYDRMIAYHVQVGLPVPMNSLDFQEGLIKRYFERDGMIFLDAQVAEYDKKRTLTSRLSQMSLVVSDENSAIEWIRQQLIKKPQTRQDIQPLFLKEIMSIEKYEDLPELGELLVQNFLYYDGHGTVPNQISTYLTKNYHDLRGLERDDVLLREKAKNRWYVPNPNQQADLEKLREKSLLREFGHYLDEINNSKKKLKVFRTEAIRVGFKKAWTEKEYQTIVTVGERLPEKVIQEDDKLLMYYDNALMRTEM